MVTKKEFKELQIIEQVELVNKELLQAKGTKAFGSFDCDFSYGFARSILTSEGYDTLDEQIVDGTKIKLFRKLNEEELQEKEKKEEEKKQEAAVVVTVEPVQEAESFYQLAKNIYEVNQEREKEDKTSAKSIPVFEDTWEEFSALLHSEEFKIYERKYIIELMLRSFIDTYKKEEKPELEE